MTTTIETLKSEMRETLDRNILSYWTDHITDHEHGGYYGRADGHDRIDATADKGAILNARILWAFAAAYRVTRNADYLRAATRAKDYLIRHFVDPQYGGIYWSVDYTGQPTDTKKQTYAIGFAIYGLSEYARATDDEESLQTAIALFHDIEDHAYDKAGNGYIEALTREWLQVAGQQWRIAVALDEGITRGWRRPGIVDGIGEDARHAHVGVLAGHRFHAGVVEEVVRMGAPALPILVHPQR